jgi:hypothetical protein
MHPPGLPLKSKEKINEMMMNIGGKRVPGGGNAV